MKNFKLKSILFNLLAIFIFSIFPAIALFSSSLVNSNLQITLGLRGKVYLQKITINDITSTKIIFTSNQSDQTSEIKTFEGLIPVQIFKADLNYDNIPEIIVVLKDEEGTEVIPFIFQTKNEISQIYPVDDQAENKLICKKIFLTNFNNQNVICTKKLIGYHDFGPPYLYKFSYYNLKNNKLNLVGQTYSQNNHFNVLMNKGAVAFHNCKYFKAINYYKQAAKQADTMPESALTECLYSEAESLKFVKDFSDALKIYQSIVLDYSQNQYTDLAQKQIELISSNLQNAKALSIWIDIANQINNENWQTAFNLLKNLRIDNASPSLKAQLMFLKAETLVALNKIDQAIKTYGKIKELYPDLPIIDSVNANLQDLEVMPEETDGL